MPTQIKPDRAQFQGGYAALRRVLPLALFLGACSSVPDAVNPIEWYRDAAGVLRGTDTSASAIPPRAVPGADQPYPHLSTVPPAPAAPSFEQRQQMERSLAADRQAAVFGANGAVPPPAPPMPPSLAAMPPFVPPARTSSISAWAIPICRRPNMS